MKVPQGTKSGKIFRLRNKGIQVLGTNRRGDQHVRVNVHIPKKLSDKHLKKLEELKEIEQQELTLEAEQEDGFFDKFKSIFN